ncbi:MAG: FlgD immunoglobulin-like domain containing protein, partial [bacterium]
VYIVRDDGGRIWSTGASLVDINNSPNTIQGSGIGGAFYNEIIALPALSIGRFDVIIDENENGVFDSCGGVMDYVLGQGSAYAFEVINTDLESLVDTDYIKADAGMKSAEWRQNTQDLVFGLQATESLMAGMSVGSAVVPVTSQGGSLALGVVAGAGQFAMIRGLMVEKHWYDLIDALGNTLADYYRDIYNDPPDSTYTEIIELGAIDYSGPANADALPAARAPFYSAMSENAALSVAFRSCVEKFFGAEEASDNTYIRIQALALREYIDLLIESLTVENEALENLRAAVDSTGFGHVTTYPDSFRIFQARIQAEGFYPQEIEVMTEAGFDSAQIMLLEEEIINRDADLATEGSTLAHIDSTIQSNLEFLPTLQDLASQVQTVIDTAALVWIDHPHADAGGPYTGSEGTTITLDGSGSTDPHNGALTYEWDVDADGVFGDLVGPVADGTWLTEGKTLVDGDAITYEWTLDDSVVGTSRDWEFEPDIVGRGRYVVEVAIKDGSVLSPDNQAVWYVEVPDCGPNAIADGGRDGATRALAIRHTWVGSGQVKILFGLPSSGPVSLEVFDVAGRRIRTLISKWLTAGNYDITWHGSDQYGNRVASGVYFCRLAFGEDTVTQKIVLVR